MSDTGEDLCCDPGTNDDFYAEEDWDSSGVQISDSSEPYDYNDYEYDDYSYHDEYENDFRMLACSGGHRFTGRDTTQRAHWPG
jgi:hypothetical protein